MRLVLRHQHEHVVPLGEIPRFPGTVLLHRAGYRRGADSFRHAAQHLDDRSLFRFRPCAGTAGVVHHPRLVLSGHGPSDGGSRHSGLYGRIGGLLCGAGRRRRADAASEQSEAQSAHQPRRGFVGPLQQPHGTVERRAVLYPSVRHRAFGRCAGAGVQHAGVGIRARRREHRGPAADYDSDSADRSRHQPFHVDHLVVRAPAASDVRRVFQERRFRNGPAQFRPDS